MEHIGSLSTKTKIAGVLFTIAALIKVLLIAIVFNPSLHWLGYILLAIAFTCLFTAIILCCFEMKNEEQPPSKTEVEKWMKYYSLNKEA